MNQIKRLLGRIGWRLFVWAHSDIEVKIVDSSPKRPRLVSHKEIEKELDKILGKKEPGGYLPHGVSERDGMPKERL